MPSRAEGDLTLDPLATAAPLDGTAGGPRRARGFSPGAIVAGRYRLVALLGRGGMGEVYRAEDLTLDQPVALKFLPDGVAADDSRLAQFHNELRVARQVSHKNVCRLYDLGDADGRRFLTMEYVDGEDLASLLRRIGRVPHDKALQIARQLCAGVAAAHDRGVLHRDLKPANVMLDGNGDVRITDFGIATAAGESNADLIGTPQYMAPEQLSGRSASIKSDVYALGLILFEVFTGRRANDATTLADLKQLHETLTVTTPSSIVRDLDPAVEQVILRCLEKDPARRPGSALAVAAALPGGDPVAAALAAGETPSPDMLAAAGETGALAAKWGVSALAVVVVGLLVFAGLSARTSIVGRVPLVKPVEVLLDRAEQILNSLGYTQPPGDRAFGLYTSDDFLGWLRATPPSPHRWDVVSTGNPPAVLLWYRTSPRDLVPLGYELDAEDPPVTDSDMRLLVLDLRGRLQEFRSVPPEHDLTIDSGEPPSWAALFSAAGLNMASFTSVAPEWTPPDFADARAAWEGPPWDSQSPALPATRMRVEAAAYHGRPVFFSIVGPWTRATRMFPEGRSSVDRALLAVLVLAVVALLVAAMWLARHNLRTNRADRRGASRLLGIIICSGSVVWIVGGHHVAAAEREFGSATRAAGLFISVAAASWVIYVALEPYVRRFWPDSLLGWSRLIAGHVLDPRVGRDVLMGALFGVGLSFIALAKALVTPALGYGAPFPNYGTTVETLGGTGALVADLVGASVGALEGALFTVLVFVVLRLLLRRSWLSVAVGVLLMSLVSLNNMSGNGTQLIWLFPIVRGALLTFIVVRFGLLPYAVALYFTTVLTSVPMTLDFTQWSAVPSMWVLAVLAGATMFGFYASRAGQPLFGESIAD